MNHPFDTSAQPPKAELRSQVRTYRRYLPADQKAELDHRIHEHIIKFLASRNATQIAAYLPNTLEPGGTEFPALLQQSGFRVWLPVCGEQYSLMWGEFQGAHSLRLGAYGLLEPTEAPNNNQFLAELDAVIIPALAISTTGARLGQGAGYYDRALADCDTLKIGVVYANEIRPVPDEPHDVRCDVIVSNKGTIWCQSAV